jgi:hypothetical protein
MFLIAASSFIGSSLQRSTTKKKRAVKIGRKVIAAAAVTVATPSMEEVKEYEFPLPSI